MPKLCAPDTHDFLPCSAKKENIGHIRVMRYYAVNINEIWEDLLTMIKCCAFQSKHTCTEVVHSDTGVSPSTIALNMVQLFFFLVFSSFLFRKNKDF